MVNTPTANAPLVSIHKLKIKCPVCDKRDNCAVSADRRIAFCRRVTSDKPGRGGWTHIIAAAPTQAERTTAQPRSAAAPPMPAAPLADIDQRDGIYTTLLCRHLVLSQAHRARLHARGLSDEEIVRRGYRSTPPPLFAAHVARALSSYDLTGVPGFYRVGDTSRMVNTPPGYFVPYRDARNRIQAMQYRPDEPRKGGKYIWLSSKDRAGGASSGAPLHFARAHLLTSAKEITVTEGGLKADVISFLTQAPVIGVPGVSNFGVDFATNLRVVAPRVRTVVLAYDSDLLVKHEVLAALESLSAQLGRARFRVRVRTWPVEWKGFDDYLLAQFRAQEVYAA